MIKNGDFFEEMDVLELTLSNGEKIRGIAEMKGRNFCKIRFSAFSDTAKRNATGQEVRIFYNEKISYNGAIVQRVSKVSDEFKFSGEHYRSLMDLALQTRDEKWFKELVDRQKQEVS